MGLKSIKNRQLGFTLVEMLVVVALIAITLGVTGDILISLVRSYNKTRVTNEIEQNANFVTLKIEKELKNAIEVTDVADNGTSITFIRELSGITTEVTYEWRNGADNSLYRIEGALGTPYLLTDNTKPGGVAIADCTANKCFVRIAESPDVINMRFEFTEAGVSLNKSFTGSIILETTVVVRGTY